MSYAQNVSRLKLRLLDSAIENERFDGDNHETPTSDDQVATEAEVATQFRIMKSISSVNPSCPKLAKKDHAAFLKKGLSFLPKSLEVLNASRTWLCYWITHSLTLLNEPLSTTTKEHIIDFLKRCQHEDGGFGGGPGQSAHLAPTYSAVNALCTLKTTEAYEAIDRKKLLKFLLRLKNKDGSYQLHDDSEVDIRGAYCALSVARLTNIWVPELYENTAQWIASCQTYEGGFGGVPHMEAHGGYTFCGFASLVILGKENMCNINNLLRWLVNRQMRYEGGFQGRTNKLVDSCYSFWQSGIFPLLHRILCVTENETMSTESWLFDQTALQEYILVCCQSSEGGLIDKPGKKRDFYHTCYALSGLSIAQHVAGGHLEKVLILGDSENELLPIHPVYNISIDVAVQAFQYFNSLPIPTLPSEHNCNEEGT